MLWETVIDISDHNDLVQDSAQAYTLWPTDNEIAALSYAGRANIATAEFQAELKRRLRPEGKDRDHESSDEESITSNLWTVEAPTADIDIDEDEENFVR